MYAEKELGIRSSFLMIKEKSKVSIKRVTKDNRITRAL